MKIAIVTQWFPPEKAYIPADIAAGLAGEGHDVTVITGFPNYPTGKVYPGWRQRAWADCPTAAYKVRRVALYPSHSRSAFRRAAGYLSYAITSTIFGWRILRRADVVYVYHPPLTTAFGPWLSRLLGGSPYVIHLQDIWPDSVLHSGMVDTAENGLLARLLTGICNAVYGRASALVSIAPFMSKLMIERGHTSVTHYVVSNWSDESVFYPAARSQSEVHAFAGGFSVMFAGNMGEVQGLDIAVRAAHEVADLEDFRLVLVGDGIARPALEKLASDLGAHNVVFVPPQPFERMRTIMQAADIQLVTLQDRPFLRVTVPSKLGAAMACGLPVICGVGSDANRIVERAGAGWTCEPGDIHGLATAFRQAHSEGTHGISLRGLAARRYYEQHLSRSQGVSKISDIIYGARVGA